MPIKKTLFAATYDRMSRKSEEAGVRALRQDLLADAFGARLGRLSASEQAHLRALLEKLC